VGRLELVERIRKHPLYRALRADKLALAALEATLEAHRRGASFTEIPALRMLTLTRDEIKKRARLFLSRLSRRTNVFQHEIIEGQSAIGGGAAPTTHPPTALISLSHQQLSTEAIEQALRHSTPPIITRIAEGRVLLDLRTVAEDEEAEMLNALITLAV
jgi:L-seryl-tRNA(Ser) seleniumtransferase